VLNGNGGITDSDYFNREKYREQFNEIFDELVASKMLTRTVEELVNSDFFKYSPFKSLTTDQAIAIEGVLEKVFEGNSASKPEPIVIQGGPGTGKTIVAVYIVKLLSDIARSQSGDFLGEDSMFSDFFQGGYQEAAKDLRVGLVVPQVSLRKTISKVFKKIPGLEKMKVLTPFDVGAATERFDLLIVDEAHRLNQRSNQPAATLNIKFRENNIHLFGVDSPSYTQLDWIQQQSKNQIFLLDENQSVRPHDLPREITQGLISAARKSGTFFKLLSQMRVKAGAEYLSYIERLLDGDSDLELPDFGDYEFGMFNDFGNMRKYIEAKDRDKGLARIIAGFAWPWKSKTGEAFDFELDGVHCIWNRTDEDWVNSKTALGEVGSIHTIQGYDLNYAGVIIGPDIKYDEVNQRVIFSRNDYFDKKGMENNKVLNKEYSDEDLLIFVKTSTGFY